MEPMSRDANAKAGDGSKVTLVSVLHAHPNHGHLLLPTEHCIHQKVIPSPNVNIQTLIKKTCEVCFVVKFVECKEMRLVSAKEGDEVITLGSKARQRPTSAWRALAVGRVQVILRLSTTV